MGVGMCVAAGVTEQRIRQMLRAPAGKGEEEKEEQEEEYRLENIPRQRNGWKEQSLASSSKQSEEDGMVKPRGSCPRAAGG